MNTSVFKNAYLLWAASLLLLTLGKVYEWAYPGFQHDYRHEVKNQIQKELSEFHQLEQNQSQTIQRLLEKTDSNYYDPSRLVHFLVQEAGLNCVLFEKQITRYWSGEATFIKEIWNPENPFNGLRIMKQLDEYFIVKKIQFSKSGTPYTLVSYQPLESVNHSYVHVHIATEKTSGSGLAIRAPTEPNKILGLLQSDATFLAPVYGNVLILFYFFVLLLFYIPVHKVSRHFYTNQNYPWGNMILLFGVLVTASMCQWIVHQNDFYHSLLTDKLIHTRFYNYTLFEFTVFSCLFFHLSYFFYKYAQISQLAVPSWAANLIVLFNFLIALFALVIYCFIFSAVFIRSDYYFDLSNIFSFNIQHFILLFDLLTVLLALFLITNKLTTSTDSFQLEFRKRFIIFLAALIIATPFILQSKLEIGLASFLLGASIIIWMQDFFNEDYQKNILWLISWIIVISILNASLIFHFQNQKKRYVKEQLVSTYVKCIEDKNPDCLADLIQNCNTNQYDFYFYEDQLLKFSSNVYKPNFEQSLNYLRKDSIRHINLEGKDILYVKPQQNQLLILSNPLESSLKGISLFSYLFTLLIVISYLISLIHQRFQFLPKDLQISFPERPSLKNRIQFYVILGIVISFLIIALTTVFFTKRSENEIFRENLISKTSNLSGFLESTIRNANNMEDAQIIMRTQIKQTSQMVDFDIRFFHENGFEDQDRNASTVYQNSIQLLNPAFYFQYPPYAEDIVVLKKSDLPDELYAYRNIFYNNRRAGVLQVEALATREMSYSTRLANLVNTLLNIYVFLFLIAASLATLLANSITSPLVSLTDKLRSIRLGKTNEVLEWKSEDEIGELIQNYNQMVNQLDESAQLLAKTERDSAWREMAKQVAHEIKNPLTPMKLSIQYLQQSIKTGSEDIKEMAQKVCHTLIEQIDSLTKIATEFSNFAKMPQAQNEKLILNEILASVHDLFRKRDDIDIHLTVPIDELYVYADKDQVIRVLNNLINNAIQAIPDTRRGQILISMDSSSRNAIICVRDNGTGIPEEMQSKVFLPNFTSKSSGTGLGLAMCQQIIELANGKIYFKTVPGKGSSFFVELPLMRIVETEDDDI
ncbi:MAG: HAMP domain-containing histidine kinase [Saprospiraceae bacterium]|nr:HAMP domain-containing histidine kinase [Saprospiraceae bacterium]